MDAVGCDEALELKCIITSSVNYLEFCTTAKNSNLATRALWLLQADPIKKICFQEYQNKNKKVADEGELRMTLSQSEQRCTLSKL